MNRAADSVVFAVACLATGALLTHTGYQYGYDTAKVECKSVPREITHKQKVRAIQWAMRDKGYLK